MNTAGFAYWFFHAELYGVTLVAGVYGGQEGCTGGVCSKTSPLGGYCG